MVNRKRLSVPASLAVAAALVPATAAARPNPHEPWLLARTPAGTQPNAPATDPALSGDGRVVRYAAYSSAATDIVAGSGGHRNVFVVVRRRPWSREGTPWRPGSTQLITRGRHGGPANGDSWSPSFSGYDYVHAGHEITVPPRCLAFVSAASNLVAGDGDHHADVFVRRMPAGRTQRLKTPGAATEVALDGRCRFAAYVAGGTVYRADLRHRGAPQRISRVGGASSPEISANGKVTTYARRGVVYVNRQGEGGTHRIAAGEDPSSDAWGREVVFTHGGGIWEASTQGAPHAHPARPGTAPSVTAAGHFIFAVNGPRADLEFYSWPCPDGGLAEQVEASPHGNYGVFSCSGGGAYFAWVGAK